MRIPARIHEQHSFMAFGLGRRMTVAGVGVGGQANLSTAGRHRLPLDGQPFTQRLGEIRHAIPPFVPLAEELATHNGQSRAPGSPRCGSPSRSGQRRGGRC